MASGAGGRLRWGGGGWWRVAGRVCDNPITFFGFPVFLLLRLLPPFVFLSPPSSSLLFKFSFQLILGSA